MRYMAIDFGMQRIGMAVSDESETLVWPHGTHRRDGVKNDGARNDGARSGEEANVQQPASRRDVAAIVQAARGLGAQGLVFGLPRALDGQAGKGEDAVRNFAMQVQSALREAGFDIQIEWWDERFSTREALGQMRDLGISQKRGRQSQGASSTDARAAAVILQGFLDGKNAARQRALDMANEENSDGEYTDGEYTNGEHAIGETRELEAARDGSFRDGLPRDDAEEAILIKPETARDESSRSARDDAEPKDLF